jgi:hypothetical protein
MMGLPPLPPQYPFWIPNESAASNAERMNVYRANLEEWSRKNDRDIIVILAMWGIGGLAIILSPLIAHWIGA